jgi:hypothetical protein
MLIPDLPSPFIVIITFHYAFNLKYLTAISYNVSSIYGVAEGNVPKGKCDSPQRICCVI